MKDINLSREEIVKGSKETTLFSWSVQKDVNPLCIKKTEGSYWYRKGVAGGHLTTGAFTAVSDRRIKRDFEELFPEVVEEQNVNGYSD